MFFSENKIIKMSHIEVGEPFFVEPEPANPFDTFQFQWVDGLIVVVILMAAIKLMYIKK